MKSPVRVTVYARTDLGRTRDHNEDTYLAADLTTRTTDLVGAGIHEVGDRGILFLVADGMGGAAAGEVASSMAADLIFRYLAEAWNREPVPSPERFTARIREAVELANERIHDYAKQHPDVRGMGTTATVVGVLGSSLYLAQVGDSRGYLVRGGVATQLTKDQSLTQRLVDAGELTEEEAEQSERRNIILQALGPDARVRVDLTWQNLRRGDTLVICSDGLYGQVKREEIAGLIKEQADLERVCERLITLANERGGPDNITAVVARFDGPGLEQPDQKDKVGYRLVPGAARTDEEAVAESTGMESDPTPLAASPSHSPALAAPVPGRRSGSPVVMAAIGLGILGLLFLLFLALAS